MRRELVPGIELEKMEDKFAWGGGGGRDDGVPKPICWAAGIIKLPVW